MITVVVYGSDTCDVCDVVVSEIEFVLSALENEVEVRVEKASISDCDDAFKEKHQLGSYSPRTNFYNSDNELVGSFYGLPGNFEEEITSALDKISQGQYYVNLSDVEFTTQFLNRCANLIDPQIESEADYIKFHDSIYDMSQSLLLTNGHNFPNITDQDILNYWLTYSKMT